LDAPSLFAEEDLPRRPLHDVEAVRARLTEMLGKMRAAALWPWKEATVRQYREGLWPSLLAKLPDADEAARVAAAIAAECARLDAA